MDRASDRLLWFVVGALVGALGDALWRRLGVPSPPASVEGKNPKLASAGRRGVVAAGLNTRRARCAECDYESTLGPLGVHHSKSGHAGRIEIDD